MADLQSKMETHDADVKRAKEQIDETTQKADSYLTTLTKRVEEYEKKHADFEPAGSFLKSALDASRAATQKLKTHSQDLSERSVPVAIEGMQGVRSSLDDLEKRAVEYDDKYAKSRGQAAVDTLHHWVNSGRQHATDALEIANDQLTKLRDAIENVTGGVQVAVGEAAHLAEAGDEKLGVSSKVGGVVQKMRDLDARLGVSATAAKVDTKVTGGLGCKMASTTMDIVTESVSYISDTLHNAKLAAQQSETAQNLEARGVALTEAVTEKKKELQSTFDESVEKGKEMVGMATEKTEEKSGQVKDKAGELKDMTAEKAGQVKEAIKDKTGMAKDKASETADQAQEKVGDVKDQTQEMAGKAKEVTQEKAGQAMNKGGDVKEQTKEMAGDAKNKAMDTAEQVTSKTGDVKEQAKEVAGDAKDMTQEKVGQAKASQGKQKHAKSSNK